MKKNYTIIALMFVFTISKAQWTTESIGIVYGEPIVCLAANGTNVFAGHHGYGMFLSTNYGNTWTAINTGLTDPYVRTIAISGTNIFAGTDNGNVFFSNNNGNSWTQVYSGLGTVLSIAISGTSVFVGDYGGGVHLSTDNGSTWTDMNNGLTDSLDLFVYSLAVSGTNILAGTDGGGIFLSTNNGNTWNPVNTGITVPYIRSLAVSDTNIFAGTWGGGIYLSTNNGGNWNAVNTGLPTDTITSFATIGSNVFASNWSDGVFLSTNNGNSWTDVNSGITLNNKDVFSLVISGTNIFAATIAQDTLLKRPLSEMINCVAYNTTSYDSTLNTFTLSIDPTTVALATVYYWDFGDGTSSTLATPTHTYANDTLYNVCMKIYTASGDSCEYCHTIGIDTLGNVVRTNGFTLIVQNATTNINEINKDNSIVISPNPFTSFTNIVFSEPQKNTTIKITDILGKEITIINFTGKQSTIEKGEMKEGIYFLQITDENNNVVNKKIIMQ